MWKMLVQKGYNETIQVSAFYYHENGRRSNHWCRGWFQTDETEILRRQLEIVRGIKDKDGPDNMIVVALQGARGYCPKDPMTVGQFEKELAELV